MDTLPDHAPKIAVIGGDARAIEAARALMARACRVTLFALDGASVCSCAAARVCEEPYLLAEALASADAVLLPVPVCRDGVNLFAPFASSPLPLRRLTPSLPPGRLIVGGRLPRELAALPGPALDLLENEDFARANALPTAESAVGLALLHHPGVLSGASCALLGYGRINSLLAPRLAALCAKVTVFARSPAARASAASAGFAALPFDDLPAASPSFDFIFNSVPAPVVSPTAARALPPDALYIELASPPGGVAPEVLPLLRCSVLPAPGLPGKYSPRYAGALIADFLLSALPHNPTPKDHQPC